RDSYRFRAEVRQDQGNDAEVGLFFGLKTISDPQGDVVCFYSLTFNDLEQGSGRVDLNLEVRDDLVAAEGGGGQRKINSRHRGGRSLSFTPGRKDGGQGPWRKLMVEVTPGRIRTFWEGKRVHELTREGEQARIRAWLKGQPDLRNLGIAFNPRGGAGFYLD